jgi:hypothetical protein
MDDYFNVINVLKISIIYNHWELVISSLYCKSNNLFSFQVFCMYILYMIILAEYDSTILHRPGDVSTGYKYRLSSCNYPLSSKKYSSRNCLLQVTHSDSSNFWFVHVARTKYKYAQVGTQSNIRDQRYRTEPNIGMSDIGLKSAESDIISDIGINFCTILDIQYLT